MKRDSITIASLIAVMLGLAGCATTVPDYDYSKEPDPRKNEYTLGVSDALDINVWKNADLSTRVSVRPDGTITMPLIGDLQAVGKTPTELKIEIKTELEKYIKLEGGEITIAVTQVSSYNFTVSGEVNQPNIFSSNRYMTVAEAIATAGGLTRFADPDAVTLLRYSPRTGNMRRIPLSYRLIANGERPDMNLVLMRGDSLHVGEK